MTTKTNMLTNNKKIQSVSLSFVMLASVLMLALTISAEMPNAEAASCSTYGGRCYATHYLTPSTSVTGVKSTNKVLYTTGDGGWIASSTWAHLIDGTKLEVLWKDSTSNPGGDPYFEWGLNTVPQDSWGSPSDNTYYTFIVEDVDQTKGWEMSAGGVTKTHTAATSYANKVETGYEMTYDWVSTDVEENDYKNLKYSYLGTWNLWNSNIGTHNKWLNPNPMTPVYHVLYCGSGAENWYHSQHGEGSGPSSC